MANGGDKFLYFLVGGFVGASVALLFAPRSGEETRQLLESKYREGSEGVARRIREGREYVANAREDLSQKVSEKVARGREAVARQKEQISSAIDAGKKAYTDEKSKLESASGESS